MKSERNLTIASCLFIAFAIIFVYWQTKGHSFISFDDYSYFAQNERVQSGLNIDNIIWAFKTSSMSNWHPVTWLSYMLDTTLHGGLPSGVIFINVLFHIANSILLFLLLLKTTGAFKESLIVALLFALHPTRVESVAWVSERKDVLSVFFMFLTIGAYIKYTKLGSMKPYIASLIFFALGLMSKPMLVSLPLLLILLDHWPLNRFKDISGIPKKLLTEKIPFILLAMLSSFITLFVQLKEQKALTLQVLSFTEKLANSLNAYMAYIKSFLIPVNLAVLYPFPESISLLKGGVSLLVFLLISALVIRERKRNPYLLTGWGFFVIALIPVIGIVQVGFQFIADRYTYMPFIGLFIIAAFGTKEAANKLGLAPYKYLTLWAMAILILTGLSYKQVSYWKDNITLYSKTVAVTKGNYLIHNKLGHALLKNGQTERAIDQLTLSVEARPDFFAATLNLASTLRGKGYHERAIKYYLNALKLRPASDLALMGTCQSLLAMGKTDEALDLYTRTTGNKVDSYEAMIYMGNAWQKSKNYPESIKYYIIAINSEPDKSLAYFRTALSHVGLKEFIEAKRNLNIALSLDPGNADASRLLRMIQSL